MSFDDGRAFKDKENIAYMSVPVPINIIQRLSAHLAPELVATIEAEALPGNT